MNEPIHIISLGAGVQSSTMSLMAAAGEITPMPVAAIFADTQAEPKSVYTWLDWLEKQLPFPVVRVSKGSLALKTITFYYSKKNNKVTVSGIPAFIQNKDGTQGIMTRQCTKDFKVSPVDKAITEQMKKFNSRTAIKWIGISTDEIYRIKDSRRSTVKHRWPMIELKMGRYDCLLWMNRNGFPEPPRSACIFCPYRSNKEWRSLDEQDFQSAVKFEQDFQSAVNGGSLIGKPWLHRSMKPLSEVDFSTEEERGQLNMFNEECTGMCGV